MDLPTHFFADGFSTPEWLRHQAAQERDMTQMGEQPDVNKFPAKTTHVGT